MIGLLPLAVAFAMILPVGSSGPSGGSPEAEVEAEVEAWGLEQADSLFLAGHPRAALDLVEGMLEEDPRDYEALWRAASFAVALGVISEEDRSGGSPGDWYAKAEDFASRGVELRPERVEARYWEVATLGRRALAAGPSEASELADRIRGGALEILDRDPDHPGAHNALGRLYYEIMALPGMSRFLGRTFAGGEALGEASWPLAEDHLRRAVELAPDMPLYRLDLARFLVRRGDRAVAREELRRVVAEARGRPPHQAFAAEARKLLREAGG
jgi:tetratricopeptide (TPR) repeat protein